jgi:hypothetical protein
MTMKFRAANPVRRSRRAPADPGTETVAALVSLTYELLDAHADTARLATDHATAPEWHNHLAYQRDLQRVGREALARAEIPRPS